MNTGLLWFFMRASVACKFIDAGLVFVRCGSGLSGKILDIFFLYFSPMVVPILKLQSHRLFFDPAPLHLPSFAAISGFLAIYLFIILSSLWVLRKMIRGFITYRKDRARGKRSWLMLLIIFLPAMISYSVRLYIVPPKFSDKVIHVDIWHGDFYVPRDQLDEWTLVDLDRPAYKPDSYGSRISRKWQDVPYLEFDFPDEIMAQTGKEISKIHINPHYEVLTEENRAAARERAAELRLDNKTASNGQDAYPPMNKVNEAWEIHRAVTDPDDVFRDIYIWRNKKGEIENLLECTPARSCAVKARFAWSHYECGENECHCKKICTDFSQGTMDYDIVYSFDKKYLSLYRQFHQQILDYVAQFYTPKPK